MKDFARALRELLIKRPRERPFLCNGNPLICTVAIVGINPATTTPFWPCWNDDTGMDRGAWIEAYKAQHDGKFSRSRAAIERFVKRVHAPVIELNAYTKQSKRKADLKPEHQTSDVLQFMLTKTKPRVILCAGISAMRVVQSAPMDWQPTVMSERHFIYWGKDYERALVERINAIL